MMIAKVQPSGRGIARVRILQAFAMVALCVLASASCVGGEDEPVAGYSEPCDQNTQCATGLQCPPAIGLCTQACTDHAACRSNLSPTSICQSGACFEPCTSSCDNGLTCTMATTTVGTCRP